VMLNGKWEGWQARASLAASAGSEPVAWGIFDSEGFYEVALDEGSGQRFVDHYNKRRDGPLKPFSLRALYTHTSPPEGAGWISVDERMPEPGMPVLLDIGKKYPIRAMWAPAKTLEASNDSDAVGDYDEATDTYYCPEGWYEWNQHEETHWFVTETPRAWAPLPLPAPPASDAKGA
jgi:hypothetical protein